MTDNNTFIIKNTHRGLMYENGVLKSVLDAGRYELQQPTWWKPWEQVPEVEIKLVDMRERDLTIRGQEILTSDKVAIRVSIVVRYRVIDPTAAITQVEDYEARIYTDVQLAARRSLSTMTLEEILTNRTKLNEDILSEVTESATSFGVEIKRADVKDLIFSGNLQDVMNRVLSAERMSEARIIEARAKAEVERIEAQTQAETRRLEAEAEQEAFRLRAQAEAEAQRVETEAEIRDLRERAKAADAYKDHPVLLRMLELEALRELAQVATARLYIDFDRSTDDDDKA